MSEEMVPVSLDDRFPFSCGPSRSCLNECCRNINQFLTPYDIIRLKRCLSIPSGEFLRTYTSRIYGPETGLPMVVFKPDPHRGYSCPFAGDDGCSVYLHRPGSCRLYPLARAVSRCRATGRLAEYYAIINESHCQGFSEDRNQTVRQWIQRQDVSRFNEMNDALMELISLKNTVMPGPLDGRDAEKIYLAIYDLDTFRDQVFNQSLLGDVAPAQSDLDRARVDDEALLSIGLAWIKHELFGRPMSVE